ncbi:alpha/beta hydrolase [Alkalihalobacillus deserti]|uniref:alpha/beta hydrolase n=1 Tax=Alkalihalobacillus deserti TaxID=2879466 RepID=UPI001D1470FF|nr:alpha/beta hydrolase [Alkalihalobacillus deserti]
MNLEFDSKAALSQMETPILWVMGEYDELFKGTLTNLKQMNLNVIYKEIKNAGHAAHVHQHKRFMSIFQSFLTKDKSIKKVEIKV